MAPVVESHSYAQSEQSVGRVGVRRHTNPPLRNLDGSCSNSHNGVRHRRHIAHPRHDHIARAAALISLLFFVLHFLNCFIKCMINNNNVNINAVISELIALLFVF